MAIAVLIGRPNVGKSTLFNRLIEDRKSIEAAESGTTRDRVYGRIEIGNKSITLIDIAGVIFDKKNGLDASIADQIAAAQDQADAFLLVVDAQAGLQNEDERIAQSLRRFGKPVIVVANKADNRALELQAVQFSEMGFGDVFATSAIHNSGLADLTERLASVIKPTPVASSTKLIKIALVGRPNVGKSTLLNHFAGTSRAIVSPEAGTTRDSVDITMPYQGWQLQFVDTAGIRRPGKVETGIEHFSVMRSISAIEQSDVVVLLVDGESGFAAGDARIAGLASELGKALVIAVNKWDMVQARLEQEQIGSKVDTDDEPSTTPLDDAAQRKFLAHLQSELAFLPWVPVVFISAQDGLHTPKVLKQIVAACQAADTTLDTDLLAQIKKVVESGHTHLPLIYSISQTATHPPTFTLIVNRPQTWHFSHVRYIENIIRQANPYTGTPIRVELKAKNVTR